MQMPGPKVLSLIALIALAASAVLTAVPAGAAPLPAPTGDVILTVSGNITNTNEGDTARFDRAMLEGMGLVDIATTTPWYDGKVTFSGVPLSVLLDRVGAEGETIKAVALNDYEADLPASDAEETGVILAMKLNGQDMTVRDKGPIFIIYPYDSSETLQTQTYYSRSSWQVTRLVIR